MSLFCIELQSAKGSSNAKAFRNRQYGVLYGARLELKRKTFVRQNSFDRSLFYLTGNFVSCEIMNRFRRTACRSKKRKEMISMLIGGLLLLLLIAFLVLFIIFAIIKAVTKIGLGLMLGFPIIGAVVIVIIAAAIIL